MVIELNIYNIKLDKVMGEERFREVFFVLICFVCYSVTLTWIVFYFYVSGHLTLFEKILH